MAESARLLSAYLEKFGSRVRIPPSPPAYAVNRLAARLRLTAAAINVGTTSNAPANAYINSKAVLSIPKFSCTWRDGRVVECDGLENRYVERHRGFESLSLHQPSR